MTSETEWADKARRLLKAELKRAGLTYGELAARMTADGMPETEASIANKLARGAFPATFLLSALKSVGCQVVRIEEL